ncbi:hypothetical protein T01_2280, partial [Trichinella spiralis]
LCTTCKIACQTVLSYKQLWYNGECGALRVVGRPSTDNCYPWSDDRALCKMTNLKTVVLSTSSEEEDQLENDELDSDAEAEFLLDPSLQLGEWLNQLQVLSQLSSWVG